MVILICVLAFALSFVLTPAVIALSWKIGAVDVPCDWRRMHPETVPRAGGIAIFLAFFIACFALGKPAQPLACALGGGALLLAVGLADDIFCLNAWVKLFFQFAATTAAVLGSGVTGGWRALAAVLWVMTLTNAHNFVDGLDGLFAGCAAIEGGALCLAFVIMGMGSNAVSPLLLALSCLGFRPFNHFPAQTFAGDCGSGTVGFLLGMLSLPLFNGETVGMGFWSVILIFAYPLTDLFAAVLRRLLRGKSPFAADRGHLHHRICAAGLTQPQCVNVLLLITAGVGVVGVLLCSNRFLPFASFACVILALVLIRIRRFIDDFT